MFTLKVKLLTHTAAVPTRDSNAEAGFDLYADESVTIQPYGSGEGTNRALISTGIAIALPDGFYGRIAPRSGLAVKQGLDVLAGVVDNSYRGEVKVALINLGTEAIDIQAGDRVAQLVATPYFVGGIEAVSDLDQTDRDEKGFGSSGR